MNVYKYFLCFCVLRVCKLPHYPPPSPSTPTPYVYAHTYYITNRNHTRNIPQTNSHETSTRWYIHPDAC